MNIIKHGKNYHEATCPDCGCVFGYVDGRIKTDVRTRWTNLETDGRYVVCPECAEFIYNI